MSKNQLLWHLWSGTKHTLISKKYCDFLYLQKSCEVLPVWVLTRSNMSPSTSWIKYSKWQCPQPAITTKGVSSETAVLLLNSFSAVNNFTLAVSMNVSVASNSVWAFLKLIHRVTIWSASFSNLFFHSQNHDLAFYSANKILPLTILFVTHVYPKLLLPVLVFDQISSRNMQKYKKNCLNGEMPRPFSIFSFQMDFSIFFSIFKNLSLVGSKNRKLNCSGLKLNLNFMSMSISGNRTVVPNEGVKCT